MRKFWTASPKTSSFLEKSKFEGYKWKKWTHFRKRVRKLGENLLFSGKESNTHFSFFGRNNKMYVVIKYIHMQNKCQIHRRFSPQSNCFVQPRSKLRQVARNDVHLPIPFPTFLSISQRCIQKVRHK